MEYLKDTENFGQTFKEGDDIEKFFEEILSFFERKVFNKTSKRVNFLLTRINDQKLEIVADGNSDKNQDSNWRLLESGGSLIIQKRVGGTWTNYLLENGTANGQMLFWDGVKWAKTEISEMMWNDINKTLGINNPTPNADSKLDVKGPVVVTQICAGGVLP